VYLFLVDADPDARIHFSAFIIFFLGVLLFTFETGSFAKFRVHTMLPVNATQRGWAYGILFAGIVPAINLFAYLLRVVIHFLLPKQIDFPAPFLWYMADVVFTIGFLCLFLQVVRHGMRFPYGWKKAIWELSSVCFLLVMLALTVYFVYRFGIDEQTEPLRYRDSFSVFVNKMTEVFGPKTHLFNLPDISAFSIALLCIGITFFKADSLGRYFSWLALQHEQTHDDSIFPVTNRTYGFFEPWIREVQYELKVMGLLAFSVVGVCFVIWLIWFIPIHAIGDILTLARWPFILIVITGLLSIPPIIPWFVSLRSLRMLPFSRKSLMFYLASIPLLVFAVYSVALLAACLYFKDWNYALNLEWCLIVVFGFSMIANSLVLLSRHTLLTFLALFCPTIAAILIFYSYDNPVEAARQLTFLYKTFTGVALLLAGYAGLYVTLAYSRPYRTKPWFG
jgi:hypothetical protein